MSQDIATLGLRIDAAQLADLNRRLGELEQRAPAAENATNRLGESTKLLTQLYKHLAAAMAAVKLFDYIKDAALLNARYETLGAVMGVVGKQAGYTAAQMEATAVALQKTGISMIESRQQATRLVQAHIDLAYASKLARIAQDAAVIGNMNSSDAFAALVHGIQSGQTEVLRTIGLNISMEQSYKQIAGELHKNVNMLSQNEKTQGILNAVIAAGADINGVYAASMDTAGKQLLSMKRYTEDLKTIQGEVFNEILTVAVMAYTEHLKDANGEVTALARNGQLKEWGQDLTDVFVWVADNLNNMLSAVKLISAGIGFIVTGMGTASAYRAAALDAGFDFQKQQALYTQYSQQLQTNKDLFAKVEAEILAGEDRFGKALAERRAAVAAKEQAAVQATADKEKQLQNIMVYYAQQREKGAIDDAKYLKIVAETMKAFTGDNHSYKDVVPTDKKASDAAAKAAKDAMETYASLIETIKQKTAASAFDAEVTGKLTEGQKFALKTMVDIRDGILKLTPIQKQKVATDLEALLVQERLTKARDDDVKAQEAAADAAQKEVSDLWDRVRAKQKEVEMFGLTERATLELEKVRLQAVINGAARLELSDQEIAKYESMLAAITALAAATGELDTKRDIKKQADEATQAWKKTADAIESALTNSIMNGFSNGKGFARNFYDSVTTLFKTMVLQPTVSAIGQSVGSVVTAGAKSVAQNGFSSFMSNGASATSLYNAFTSSTLGQFASGYSGSAAAASEALGAPMTAAAQAGSYASAAAPIVSGVLGGLAAYNVGEKYGGVGGAVAGVAAGAGTIALGGAASAAIGGGAIAAGATAALAAIPVWGWAALAAIAIVGSMQDGPESSTRIGFNSNNAAGAISINERGNEGKRDAYIAGTSSTGALGSFGVTSTFWATLGPTVETFVKTVTQTDDALAQFMTTTEKAAAVAAVTGVQLNSVGGAEGTDANSLGGLDRVFAQRVNAIMQAVDPALAKLLDGFTGTSQALASEATAILDYRKNLPAVSAAIFGAVVTVQDLAALRTPTELIGAALTRVTAAFTGTNSVLQSLGVSAQTVFGQLGLASLAARQRLIDMAGGVDTLNAATSYFAQTFLPEADRMAPIVAALGQRMADLGYAGVTTADGFRDAVMGLVNSGALATSAGASTYIELLKMSEAFKYVDDAAKAAATASAEAAAKAAEATKAQADLLRSTLDKSLALVGQVVDAEKERRAAAHEIEMAALAERITATTAGLEKTRALSQALAGTLDQMASPSRAAAQAQIATAVAIARAGGPLPAAGDLSAALATLAQDASAQFSSLQDFQRDQLRTANDVAALAGLSGAQETAQQQLLDALNAQQEAAKTAYEAEVARLDAVVANAQKQVDLLTSVDASLLTVAQAMGSFTAALDAARGNASIAADIPHFASGGRHAGGWRLVGERGPELEQTGPSTITSNANLRGLGGGDDLRAEMAAMRQEMASGLMTIARHAKKAGDALEKFDRDGLPAERV